MVSILWRPTNTCPSGVRNNTNSSCDDNFIAAPVILCPHGISVKTYMGLAKWMLILENFTISMYHERTRATTYSSLLVDCSSHINTSFALLSPRCGILQNISCNIISKTINITNMITDLFSLIQATTGSLLLARDCTLVRYTLKPLGCEVESVGTGLRHCRRHRQPAEVYEYHLQSITSTEPPGACPDGPRRRSR